MKQSVQILVSLLGVLVLLCGCQALSNDTYANHEEPSDSTDPEQTTESVTNDSISGNLSEQSGNEADLVQPSPEENDEEESVEQDEPQQRFVVHPRNYFVYPVLEEDEQFEEPFVLLTFDDTPTGDATEQILDTLDRYDAKAIFFVNGHYAAQNVELLKRIQERGHLIGNHTWWHISIRKEDPETVREEIVGLNDFLEEQLGERPVYFRPPYGQNSDVSLRILQEEGMQTMNWSNGSLDWELDTPEEIVDKVLSDLQSGDNILFHDKQITAEALDQILSEIQKQGYRFVLPTEVVLPEEAEQFSL